MIDKFIFLLGTFLLFGVVSFFIFLAHRPEPFKPGEFRSFLWQVLVQYVIVPSVLGALIWQSTCNWIETKQREFDHRGMIQEHEEIRREMRERLERSPEQREYIERTMEPYEELFAAEIAAAEENDR